MDRSGNLNADVAELQRITIRHHRPGRDLLQARIARGWSQRHLAERLGIGEQQIQRYEANGYATTSLTRLCEIAAALGLQITETAHLSPEPSAA